MQEGFWQGLNPTFWEGGLGVGDQIHGPSVAWSKSGGFFWGGGSLGTHEKARLRSPFQD